MSTESLPMEWQSLPQWVKRELLHGEHDLSCYSRHIQRLADHGENMKAVWRLFEMHHNAFTNRPPVYSVLTLLEQADSGLDPGLQRSDDDRQTIAEDIQKHVDELTAQLSRLGSGLWFGRYPVGIENVVDLAAWEETQRSVEGPFKEATVEITEALDAAAVSPDVKESILNHLEWLQFEMERKFEELYADPRASLKALAEGAKEWADTCNWERNNIIWHIWRGLVDWFGGNQYAATATLTTVVVDQEISEDTVAGVIKRRLRAQNALIGQGQKQR